MANLVRTHNWSLTPLGPIENWSKELIAVVNLTLSSPTPARTLWGPDLLLIYNDSYRTIPGKKHPEALGKAARDVYKEAWHVVGPLLENALASGETFYVDKLQVPIDMGSGIQDIYLDYTYSPVYENGKVAGLFGLLRDVTGEVLATRHLRETEARASRVLESIGDAVIVTDVEARVVQMNPVAEKLTGWTLENAAGLPLHEVFQIIDETSREPVESPADKVKRLGTVVGFANHTILIRRDGAETSIDDSGAPIFDDDGNLTGMVLVFRDINERRSAERERTAIATQLFLVLDATTDGVLSIDREWKMIFRNRRAQEILQPTGELTGRRFWDVFPATIFEGSPYVEHYHRAMNERIPGHFEAYYPAPLNAWFSLTVQPADYGIVLFFRDITAQRMEAEALRDSEARLNAIYSTSLEYIGLITPEGTIIDCNRASLEFAGNTRADVVGKSFPDTPWFTSTPGSPEFVRRAIASAAAGETVRSEISLVRPSGDTMVFDFSLTPVRDKDGNVKYLVPEARDITEVKRTEAALLKSEKLAAVGRLASSIAHEINNPLESVMNLIYLARHSSPPEAERYLDVADQEIRRVSIIANQTLRFHKQASKPQAATSADLFSTVMSIYEGRLRNAKVRVEKRFRTDNPVVCFQGDVRQVLNNLVSNALEAMPFGGRLLIRSREGRDWNTNRPGLILTIADNGTGISPSVKKNIFDAFFTTKGTAGNGLGLWVCQEIVARHHGVLRVRSTQRKGRNGTTFAFFLPYDPA
ncbi:MAG TPA: PAS domain-containing protein [Terracidiphilus sp.]|jgi:PAS domain S-box-containing protein